MTRIRKMLTKEMLFQQVNYLKLNTNETEMPERKREESSEMPVKKKIKLEEESEDFVEPIGKLVNITGAGEFKKLHYETFIFYGIQYEIEDSVLLVPENPNEKLYVAIIKDIYKQEKENCMKLKVQWFYRPTDVEKKYVGKWKSKYSREIFYSFHQDEVYAESVKRKCLVHFVPENKEFIKRKDHRGYIAQKVYDDVNKKLMSFSYKGFNVQQKKEIDLLLTKTISRLGDLPDISKK